MAVLYTNNARSTLAASITASQTSLTVASGDGGLFPHPANGDVFYATLANQSESAQEIVRVNARSVDTFTVVRGQDGTSAQAWAAGDKVELRLTRAMLDDFKNDTRASEAITENLQLVSANRTLSAGSNGTSLGPVTLGTGVAVTVGSDQAWLIFG